MKKLLIAAAIIFCAAGLAQAVVIDDFSQDREFYVGYVATPPPVIFTDYRTGTNDHIIGGRCDITFDKRAGNIPNPYLGYSPWGPFASYNSTFGSRALWNMEYGKNADLNANLLSANGTKFEIEVSGDLYIGPRPVPCTITLISGKGSPQQATASVTQNLTTTDQNPNIISFNYSTFTGINFSDVDNIKVEMSMLTVTQDAVDYGIYWIKTDNVPPTTVIELSSFTVKAGNNLAKLKWVTETEIDNAGFNIWRADAADGEYVKLNDEIIPAKGSETKGANYVFTDKTAKNRNIYFYKLQDIDVYGISTFHGPASATPKFLLGIFNR